MLTLLFSLGKDTFAVDSARVVEVIPRINLKKLARSSAHIAGVFDYRGRIVPVVDLCRLICGTDCKESLSTRIILFKIQNGGASESSGSGPGSGEEIIGLMAEKVTETRKMSPDDFLLSGVRNETHPYLGEVSTSKNDMIQFIRVESLLGLPSLHTDQQACTTETPASSIMALISSLNNNSVSTE
ncbi:MAG: chemotaxis protein CheW [Candidatus Riflebacteria bacterium]|nr:chemotaxis protein CheW [Candidatus Riflebacteria bacterium]